jgi:zinc and cadmium transporter
LANLVGGVFSLIVAALLTFGMMASVLRSLVSLSAGLLLATSTLHLLPEAFEHGGNIHQVGIWLLFGLLVFFGLERLALLRHSHHHEGDGHAHHHGHDREEAGPGGALILIGDAVHNFTDGVLIAAAFLANPALGWVTAIAVAAHEIPQEVGDFIVLLNAGYSRRRAFVFNMISSLASVVGGVLGWAFLEQGRQLLPAALCIAAAGFLYVALADIVPSLHKEHASSVRQTVMQVLLIGVGVAIAAALAAVLHGH